MKLKPTACGLLTLGLLLPAVPAQVTETETKTETRQSADGKRKETTSTTTTTFNPEARTKVVQYFDTYKTSPHGLPPDWATQIKVKEMPAAWRRTRISPGAVITEKERPYLVEAPAELIRVLPPPAGEVRYYVAGSNVVAVDRSYQVVDSIQIPSVRFDVEEDDDDDD